MFVVRRTPEIDAKQYIYPDQADYFVKKHGGVVDRVTGALYLQTSRGVEVVPYGSWILSTSDMVVVMSEAEVFLEFEPVNPREAKDYLGGRAWPGPKLSSD